VDEKEAAGVASRARRIGARFPKDAAVQTAVAEAELDAKNYDAAIAAADLALAAKPDHPDATLFKARALMEKGQKDPASADWAAIRSMLARLNRADPEDPEPLMYFYKSFESAGASPSRNAVEGLLSALELAPKDTDLRMMVVRRLLRDKKLAEARIALGPIANDPQGGDARDRARKANAAIDAGNAEAALTALEDPKEKKRG
jgi:predicted Zn-dependent protease